MELKINEERENPLFDRKEVSGIVSSEKTPSRNEILQILSSKYSIPAENIKIKKITGKFGKKLFLIEANIYSSKQRKDEIELKKKKEKEAESKASEKIEAKKIEIEETEVEPAEEGASE
ncbi:hypothetical protein FJZ20_01890 [Candidatus Pacearchaeota archaeon]|nr:hypothetical protein [Candidatus Pacearchaeota archaeon]